MEPEKRLSIFCFQQVRLTDISPWLKVTTIESIKIIVFSELWAKGEMVKIFSRIWRHYVCAFNGPPGAATLSVALGFIRTEVPIAISFIRLPLLQPVVHPMVAFK